MLRGFLLFFKYKMASIERYIFIIDPQNDKSFKVEQTMNRINTVVTSDLKLDYHNECVDFDAPCSVILEHSEFINVSLSKEAEYVMQGRVLNIGPSKYLNISFGGLIGQFTLANPIASNQPINQIANNPLINQITSNQPINQSPTNQPPTNQPSPISKNRYFLYIVKK